MAQREYCHASIKGVHQWVVFLPTVSDMLCVKLNKVNICNYTPGGRGAGGEVVTGEEWRGEKYLKPKDFLQSLISRLLSACIVWLQFLESTIGN